VKTYPFPLKKWMIKVRSVEGLDQGYSPYNEKLTEGQGGKP